MPLLWLSLALVSGIGLASVYQPGGALWPGLIFAGCWMAWVERKARRWNEPPPWRRSLAVAPGLLLAALALGALRYQLAQPIFTAADLAWYNEGEALTLTGVVSAAPDVREAETRLRLRVETLVTPAGVIQPRRSSLLAVLPNGGGWQYGDRLQLSGDPRTPFENDSFSYREYLNRQGIHTIFYYPQVSLLARGQGNPFMAAIDRLRQRADVVIGRIFSEPESALLTGILLGVETNIPQQLQTAFRDTGTAHIIAISGFNMTILAGLMITLFGRLFRKPWAGLLAGAALIFYTLLVGASPAVVRAAIMACLALFGHLIGRRQSGAVALSITAASMCLVNPLLLWDASFQLSFTATLGLVLYADPLQAGFTRWAQRRYSPRTARRLAGPVGEYLLFTLAAQITTLPVIAFHFQRLSLSTLLANPLVLPVQPLVMILGGLALLGGLLWLPLGQVLGWVALPLTSYTIRMVEWLAQLPDSVFVLNEFPGWLVLVYYAALFGFTLGGSLFTPLRRRMRPLLLLLITGLLAAAFSRSALAQSDTRLRISLPGLEDADTLLLQTPAGNAVLINGSPEARPLADALGRRLPPFDHDLAAVILAGQSKPQLEGLPAVLERFPAAQAIWAGPPAEGRAANNLADLWRSQGITAAELSPPDALVLGQDITLRLLAAPNADQSALLLQYGRLRALIPGGIPPKDLLTDYPELRGVSVLILSAEDLENHSPANWLAFSAQTVLVQADLPDPPLNWFTTGARGWIQISTDGEQLWLESQRGD